MQPPRVLILAPVAIEAKAVARAMGIAPPAAGRPSSSTFKRADSLLEIELHLIGMKARRLPPAGQPFAAIILAGLAGALDPSLEIGDVVVDGGPEALPPGVSFRRGAIHTAARIVATPAEKAALYRATGALAVDMEAGPVRAWAARRGAPLICVRGISDTARDTLDPSVLGLIDAYGRPRPLALAAGLARRPDLVPYLRRLGADSARAARAAAEAVRALLRDTPFPP